MYVGKGQASNEAAILSNTYGSQRYSQFLRRLGTLLSLNRCHPRDMYIGGLDHENGTDGQYTYAWHDEVVQSKYCLHWPPMQYCSVFTFTYVMSKAIP